jgi:hypothetical protein
MSISNSPYNNPFPHWSTEEESPHPERYLPIPTPAILKRTSLFGIQLKSSLTGETLPDETIQDYIAKAISRVEHELNIFITPVHFSERHDYNRKMWAQSYAWIKLNNSPVLDVQEIKLSFSNQSEPEPALINFPLEHVFVDPQDSAIRLVPAYGSSLSGFLLSSFAGAQFHAMIASGLDVFPGAVRIKYRAGFDNDKCPALIASLVEKMAAYMVLSNLGHLIFPYNSVSIGIDGVSQGTGNAGNQFLTGRLQDLAQQIQQEMEAVKSYYNKRVLVDFI